MKKAIILFGVLVLLIAFAFPVSPAYGVGGASEFDGYIVKLKEEAPDSVRLFSFDESNIISEDHGLFLAEGKDELDKLIRSGLVEYYEPNYKVSLMGEVNDPYYSQQWNLLDIGAGVAWDSGFFGAGVRVAIIDSGINAGHEDFAGSTIAQGANVIDDSNNVIDQNGHGTFVSGVIAAQRNNGKGIAGITDLVELIPIKCFVGQDTDIKYVIKAVYKAVDDFNCDVINLSLGLRDDLQSFRESLEYANSKGVIIVSSVGNDGEEKKFYPAAYDSVTGVGAVGKNGDICSFSQFNDTVFVTAPGEALYSLGTSKSDSYVTGSGTSFATPHVTALAIIAKGYDKSLNSDSFKQLLIDSADDRGIPGYDVFFGNGYIEMDRFVECLTGRPVLTFDGRNATASVMAGSSVTVDMSTWFTGEGLTYSLYADTAKGETQISGSKLTFTPAAADTEKTVRIIISAEMDGEASTEKAVLYVAVDGEYTSTSADKFTDVVGHWGKNYIAFGVDMGLLTGTSDKIFEPDGTANRAMLTTILARLSGENFTRTDSSFSDVAAGDWFAGAVYWAANKGLVTGYGNGKFGPYDNITREQLALFMYRYARTYGIDSGSYDSKCLYGYKDFENTASWAKDAMSWAVSNSLISGRSPTALAPQGTATRAEIAGVLQRFYLSFIN